MSLSVKIKKKLGDFLLDVTFDTGEGVLGLLGASGCGKSMTLKCIAGIETPDEGQIVLNERVLFDSREHINVPPQKRGAGYLFQDYALFPNMTVFQNIMCGARDKDKTAEYIRRFDLSGKEQLYPAQLSGGQKQRVALARMLAAEPEVILLDEPFTALDNFLKARMEREVMNVLEGFDNPVVFVSHDRNESYRLTDTIAVMENGRIVDISEKHELFQSPKTLAATLLTGCKNVTRLERTADGNYLAMDWGIQLKAPTEKMQERETQEHGREVREQETQECGRRAKEPDAQERGQKTQGKTKPENDEHMEYAKKNIYRYAGFRAHYLVPELEQKNKIDKENLLTCDILREVEDTFSVVIQFYQKGLKEQTEYSLLTYETGKEDWKKLKEECADGDVVLRIPEAALIWMEN